MQREQQIADNLARVRERIAAAARRSGRASEAITLVAVTKTHGPAIVRLAQAAGITDCGENRVQEAEQKIAALRDLPLRWHLIGHLQRNKARRAVALFDLIHSVDSLRLAQTLDRLVAEQAPPRRLPVLLQINVSGEASKEGFDLPGGLDNRQALPAFYATIAQIVALPHLELRGLMTIAPYSNDPETTRPVFRALRLLRDDLARRFPQAGWNQLSMGMTNDFEVAIEEGATIVRIGRALFGERIA
ncbi:YggS family pyridoxal phosphate-dependent enzyme [Kallotenue papyrolyticum]|uniref:YggS family pyridoxal phosphate-dependent enzyme n=1 Tax=Kallotenue papyrolyticum TaxID=1325125 RepID=UPI000492B8D2|nr:YggS family pyridoxal phosphate-dependent enzyme [Kallotenue papyrolyticum]